MSESNIQIVHEDDPSDDEFKRAEKRMFVETSDEGEIVQLYLRGRQYNDETLHKVLLYRRVESLFITLQDVRVLMTSQPVCPRKIRIANEI